MEVENGKIYCTTVELAMALNLTDRRVRQLRSDGVIEAMGRNKYDLTQALQGYINFLTGGSDNSKEVSSNYHSERAKLTKAKRETAEIELALLRNEVHAAEDITAVVAGMLMAFRARLLALPTKMAPMLLAQTELTKIQDILRSGVYECLSELSEYDPADFAGKGATVNVEDEAP